MAGRKKHTPSEVTAERLEWLEREIAEVRKQALKIEKRGASQASAAYRRQAQALREEYDCARIKAAELAEAGTHRDPRTMSADEWRAYREGDAEQATDADLEVYVAAYLRRTGARLVHGAVG